MKTNQKYALLSVVTALALTASSIGAFSFAQVVTPLSCSVASTSVNQNQAAVFTASGGNGSYAWSGTNLNITNSGGNQFAVSYPNPGTYIITVASAGQTANCSMTVVAASTGTLACAPSVQNVTLGQTASVSASGGNGTYTWSSPDVNVTNPNGSGFSVSYASIGLKTLVVRSGTLAATCSINVLPAATIPPVDPGLPNTGAGFDQ